MNYYEINASPSGEFSDIFRENTVALDENENIYVLSSKGEPIVLWICDIELNFWKRRYLRFPVCLLNVYWPRRFSPKLLCVRKDILYLFCFEQDEYFHNHKLVSIELSTEKVTCLRNIREIFPRNSYPYCEVSNDEIRIFKFHHNDYYEGKLSGYDIFHLSDGFWTKRDLTRANVIINWRLDFRIYVWGDDIYVCRYYDTMKFEVKKYDGKNGFCYQFYQKNDICFLFIDRSWQPNFFFPLGDRLCYLEESVLTTFSKQPGGEQKQYFANFFDHEKMISEDLVVNILRSSNKLYILRVYNNGHLSLACISFEISLLKEMTVRKIAENFDPEVTTFDKLWDKIGRKALRFREFYEEKKKDDELVKRSTIFYWTC
jgi:hypothetical protein